MHSPRHRPIIPPIYRQAYTCICACGPNPAILHYGHAGRPNSRQLGAGELALLDMGAEYHCYAADITCSFPVVDAANGSGGRFTAAQRLVYEAVLDAQRAVYKALRPGASWADLHELAEAAILRALLAGGVLSRAGHGSDEAAVDSMMAAGLGAVFMPHGLGHLIGLDTHDVGGYLPGTPERSTRPGLSKLRTSREVEAGMVLTVEPGCYFIDLLLDRALASTEQAPQTPGYRTYLHTSRPTDRPTHAPTHPPYPRKHPPTFTRRLFLCPRGSRRYAARAVCASRTTSSSPLSRRTWRTSPSARAPSPRWSLSLQAARGRQRETRRRSSSGSGADQTPRCRAAGWSARPCRRKKLKGGRCVRGRSYGMALAGRGGGGQFDLETC